MRIFGESAIGPLHLVNTTPCQDAYAYDILPDEYSVIAVSDGLGSALLSDFGSKDAVDAVLLKTKQLLSEDIGEKQPVLLDVAKQAVFFARKQLENKRDHYGCELRDLACTLIVVVIHRDSVAVAHIGDGAVVAKKGQDLHLVSSPGDSEYANIVTPLTSQYWEKSLRVEPLVSECTGIMVFSDGLQRAALQATPNGPIPFDGFCNPLFHYASEITDLKEAKKDIKNLLSSNKICSNSEDDKTLVIAVYGNDKELVTNE